MKTFLIAAATAVTVALTISGQAHAQAGNPPLVYKNGGLTFMPGEWAFACPLPLRAAEYDPITQINLRVRIDQAGKADAIGVMYVHASGKVNKPGFTVKSFGSDVNLFGFGLTGQSDHLFTWKLAADRIDGGNSWSLTQQRWKGNGLPDGPGPAIWSCAVLPLAMAPDVPWFAQKAAG
jgi:hypothetical protein